MQPTVSSSAQGGAAAPASPSPAAVPVAFPSAGRPAPGCDSVVIDCAECRHRDTPVCDDCVVSFIVGRRPDDAIVVDADEVRAVRLLAQAGLVPEVRHSKQVS